MKVNFEEKEHREFAVNFFSLLLNMERPTTREETSKNLFRVKTNNFNNDKENETADEYEEDPIVFSLADQFVCLSDSKKKKLT